MDLTRVALGRKEILTGCEMGDPLRRKSPGDEKKTHAASGFGIAVEKKDNVILNIALYEPYKIIKFHRTRSACP